MKKMNEYQKKKSNNRNNKSLDNKNAQYYNLNARTKKINNFINIKREIINKNNEEANFKNKKSKIYKKQKSIDNTNQKYILNNITSSINNNNQYFKKQIRPIKFTNKNNNQNKINNIKITRKKNQTKRNLSIDNNSNHNIKNDISYKKAYKKLSNITNPYLKNSYYNFQNKKSSDDIYSDSNDRTYENEIIKFNSKNVVTTFVQIEDLTQIPVRMGGTQNRYADYDYNEAKRAAVTCRRIEYSYNLRNVIKSEICLDEVIMIQRWWRNILRRKNEELLKDLKIIEKININNIQRYILFLNKIHYVYVLHLLNDFFNKFKIRYGKLYYKNYFNRNAIKIQRAFREFLSKRKSEGQNKLKILLNKYIYKYKKEKLLEEISNIHKIINKIKFLQNFFKYYLLRKKENYLLKFAHEIHPFIYYLLKYRIPKTKQRIRKYKRKTKRFLIFIEKWKNLVRYKRMIKYMTFLENITFIIKKKFFIFFILRLVERINAMITYFLLQPLMKNILRNYYLTKINNAFLIWKKNDKLKKKRYKLAMNLIKKTIKIYTINSLIKELYQKNKNG